MKSIEQTIHEERMKQRKQIMKSLGTTNEEVLEKAEEDELEKAIYVDNSKNRRKNRVGQTYGGETEEEKPKKADKSKSSRTGHTKVLSPKEQVELDKYRAKMNKSSKDKKSETENSIEIKDGELCVNGVKVFIDNSNSHVIREDKGKPAIFTPHTFTSKDYGNQQLQGVYFTRVAKEFKRLVELKIPLPEINDYMETDFTEDRMSGMSSYWEDTKRYLGLKNIKPFDGDGYSFLNH